MGRRAVIIVLDGVGVGEAPDAADFSDEGSDTLGNTARRVGGLSLPNMQSLGLGNIHDIEGVPPADRPRASWGVAVEHSAAKATLAGHWEMMGLVLDEPLPTYPQGFPPEIVERFERETGRGVIGNRPASGTEILEELGPAQQSSGDWILYTSADSVFQIAAHTGVIPLDELYEACEKAHKMLIREGRILVERVIARPYHSEPGAYVREHANRRDYGIEPHAPTYMDHIKDAGLASMAVGKIRDIFDSKGITEHLPGKPDDAAKIDATLQALARTDAGLVFTNLVDFDAEYGHRRDPEGMAENLQRFDDRVPDLLAALTEEDLLILTADHGNDPTYPGTDHTRERVPILAVARDGSLPENLGVRDGFSDLGATAAGWLGVEAPGLPGISFTSSS